MTPGSHVPADESDREDRRRHLDHIQGIINRLATASATIKGWSITLAGAAFGVGAIRDNGYLYILGLLALVAFALLDSHYLEEERKFRDLHAATVANRIEPFCLDTRQVPSGFVDDRDPARKSWAVKRFYGPLLLVGIFLAAYAFLNPADDNANDSKDEHHSHHDKDSDRER